MRIYQAICKVHCDLDGLHFDPESVSVFNIREAQEYGGQCIKLRGYLGRARIDLQIDIGFGDVITPGPDRAVYPSLLNLSEPEILTYTPETVIAEKLQAMVDLGFQNSRMKDFYDMYVFSGQFCFEGKRLVDAIQRTFQRRHTLIPESEPMAFSEEFATDSQKAVQWIAFLRKNKLENTPENFEEIIKQIRTFLVDPLQTASQKLEYAKHWNQGGPWRKENSAE